MQWAHGHPFAQKTPDGFWRTPAMRRPIPFPCHGPHVFERHSDRAEV